MGRIGVGLKFLPKISVCTASRKFQLADMDRPYHNNMLLKPCLSLLIIIS